MDSSPRRSLRLRPRASIHKSPVRNNDLNSSDANKESDLSGCSEVLLKSVNKSDVGLSNSNIRTPEKADTDTSEFMFLETPNSKTDLGDDSELTDSDSNESDDASIINDKEQEDIKVLNHRNKLVFSAERRNTSIAKELDKKWNKEVPPVNEYSLLFEPLCAFYKENYNFCIVVSVVCIVLSGLFFANMFSIYFSGENKVVDLNSIKKKFTTQDEFLWLAFQSGVQDVIEMERPSTFILLYEDKAKTTLTNLLHQLSKYAICSLTDCSETPIELTDEELNSAEVVRDYGAIIEKYRDKLREKGVMIIKNLEKVTGRSAQVFHSLCDEVTPLVQKSLFIFTMKVDELPRGPNKMKFLEEYFRRRWTDIKADTLSALITRITSMVLEVRA